MINCDSVTARSPEPSLRLTSPSSLSADMTYTLLGHSQLLSDLLERALPLNGVADTPHHEGVSLRPESLHFVNTSLTIAT